MSGTPKRTYTREYRAEAVKLVTEQGMTQSAAAHKLGLSSQTYSNWVVRARAGKLYHVDNQTGARSFIGSGFAGNGTGTNNVAQQCTKNAPGGGGGAGPLPATTYTMKNVPNADYGANALKLTPKDKSKMCGRNSFWMHAGQGASDGCIDLFSADALAQVAAGVRAGDTELRVIGTCQ